MNVSTASPPDRDTRARLAHRLTVPVWNAMSMRADALRRSLPPRPDTAPGRYAWWRSLSPTQARQAELLDRLNALCGHLAGHPALGYRAGELPEAALEAADGYTSEPVAQLIADYRALQEQGRAGRGRRTGRPGTVPASGLEGPR
ncbi:hypothetical protein [Streptomyces sp. NPDC018045]|uniref:hypothetical protein n=1 Tax=Streptomyces sp. NPDC018045 TaxID=3365037 RepID=UPI003789B339